MTADELRELDSEAEQEIEDLHQRIASVARDLIAQAGDHCTCKINEPPCPICRLKELVVEIEKNPWPLM